MSQRKRGATSVSLDFRLTDATTGAPKTGLTVTTLKLQYHRPGEAPSSATSLTLLASQTATFAAYGAREVDATNSPGVYRVDCPDAAFAGSADEVVFTVNSTAIQPSSRLVDLFAETWTAGDVAGARYRIALDGTQTAPNATLAQLGTIDANLVQVAGHAATAAAGVTFPASIGTSTFAGGAVSAVTAPVTVAAAGLNGVLVPGGIALPEAVARTLSFAGAPITTTGANAGTFPWLGTTTVQATANGSGANPRQTVTLHDIP